ncbi:MAG: hypothetical protein HY721_11870 [Planctomycetes bacterium]|nr:hypothetical protein [Planctomycetota bacterium]
MPTSRIQPSLSPAETEIVDHVATLTGAKRTEVIKNALAVYHWFVQQAITGASILARKPSGEESVLTTPELQVLEGRGRRLSPKELGVLAKRLEKCTDPVEAARLKEQMTRGFYGI